MAAEAPVVVVPSAGGRALRWLRVAALAGLLPGLGCSSAPDVGVDTPYGQARADDRATAEALAELLGTYGPRVRALLPDARAVDPEVWLEDFSLDSALSHRPDVVGLAAPGLARIRIREDRLGRDAECVLVHELVHAHLGPSWEPLPALLKEGLCDVVAFRLAPESAAPVRALRLLDAAAAHADMALELSWFEPGSGDRQRERLPMAAPPGPDLLEALGRAGAGVHLSGAGGPDLGRLYGSGWLLADCIVSRVGLDGLNALCRDATAQGLALVPTEWLVQAAGVEPGGAGWPRAVLERVGTAELTAQGQVLAPQLSSFVWMVLAERVPSLDAHAFLSAALPTLGWEGGRTRVALATLPALVSELDRLWQVAAAAGATAR